MTNNTLFAASLLSLLLSSGLPAQGGGPTTGEPPTLTIRLYNYAEAPAVLLDDAAEIGGQIFRRAGIDTVWVTCAASPDQPSHRSCDESPGKRIVHVNILNREMSAKLGTDPNAFGLAFTSDIEFGQFATVFSTGSASWNVAGPGMQSWAISWPMKSVTFCWVLAATRNTAS
jgi:hypothetical protein